MNMYAERTERITSEKDKTGIPRRMKAGFEHSSGFSFDDVRVHYNSEKPAQLHAHAYTQGNEVYVAPGQEKHLPHELGHVVQQKSDMVKPTGEIGGLPLNDNEEMEKGADMIAENAENAEDFGKMPVQAKFNGDGIVQRNAVDTQDAYNGWAGFGSTFVGMLGIAGGIGSFLYTKHNDRKHRYIEEIEKYADAACDAQEEQVAANEQYNHLKNDDPDKIKAYAEISKLKAKVERNYNAAINKADAMGAFKDPLTTRMGNGLNSAWSGFKNFWGSLFTNNEQTTDESPDGSSNTDNTESSAAEHQAVGGQQDDKINKVDNANVKNALARAKKAYDKSEEMNVDALQVTGTTEAQGAETPETRDEEIHEEE